MKKEIQQVQEDMARQGYIAEQALVTALYLSMQLNKPLLIEGEAGVGKTEVAKVLAGLLQTELIRLQCYEGLDVHTALYEWNYQKQILRIRLEEGEKKAPPSHGGNDLLAGLSVGTSAPPGHHVQSTPRAAH